MVTVSAASSHLQAVFINNTDRPRPAVVPTTRLAAGQALRCAITSSISIISYRSSVSDNVTNE